jgi:XTP/dITP diphosphohydrolase
MKLVLATNNGNKVREIKSVLGGFFPEVVSMSECGLDLDIEETGTTFAENAAIKAETVCRLTGCAALADDSGLSVDALGGAPGIYSARFAGEGHNDDKNIDKLLSLMSGIKKRQAKFFTALALIYPDGRRIEVCGETSGEITEMRMGNGGFGYDPVFFSYELKKTFGEASEAEKNAVSHRGKALEKLKKTLNLRKNL